MNDAAAVLVREAPKGFFYARLRDGLWNIKLRHFVQFCVTRKPLGGGRLRRRLRRIRALLFHA